MAEFQKLREGGYGTTFSNNYLEQGRYAEAVASTGAEAGLVDRATPDVRFVEAAQLRRRARHAARRCARRCGPLSLDATVARRHAGRCRSRRRPRSARRRSGPGSAVPERQGRVHRRHGESRSAGDARTEVAPVAVVAGDYDNDERVDLLVARRRAARCCCTADRRRPVRGRRRRRRRLPRRPRLFAIGGVRRRRSRRRSRPLARRLVIAAGGRRGPRHAALAAGTAQRVCCATTATARSPTSRRESGRRRPARSPASRGADRLRQSPRRRSASLPRDGRAPALLKNMRDGTFRDVAADVGPARRGPVYGDRRRRRQQGRLHRLLLRARRRHRACWRSATGAAASPPARRSRASPAFAAQFVDSTTTACSTSSRSAQSGPLQVWRNVGDGVAGTSRPRRPALRRLRAAAQSASLAAGDLDGDGDTDLVVKTWSAESSGVVRNDGGNRHASLSVRAHRPRQQPQRDRLEGGAARRQPALAARDLERDARRRARRSRLRPRHPHRRRRRPRPVACRHPAGRDPRRAEPPAPRRQPNPGPQPAACSLQPASCR